MKKVGELRFVDEVPAGAVGTGDIAAGAVTEEKLGEDVQRALKAAFDGKADRPATFTEGNLASLDAQGNLADSGIPKDSLSGSNVKLGANASIAAGSNNTAIGANAKVNGNYNSRSVAIGPDAASNNERSVALGDAAAVSASCAAAIGYNAKVAPGAVNAVQLGAGENSLSSSLRFMDTVVVDDTGKIPAASLGAGAARVRSMTQAEYDALGEYDENTIYVIVNG